MRISLKEINGWNGRMKILHLLSCGGIGGIEILCQDIAELSREQNEFCFLYRSNLIGKIRKIFRLVKRE